MSFTIVQQPTNNGHSVSSLVLTFGSAPTTGNLMLAFVTYSQGAGANSANATTGWTKLDDTAATASAATSQACFYRVVQSGDGTGYTFTTAIAGGDMSGIMLEISGVNSSTPINQHNGAPSGSGASGSITPSVLGCLPIYSYSDDQGNQFGAMSVTSLSSGWTNIVNAQAPAISTFAAFGPVTTDTTTAISCTMNVTFNNGGSTEILLLAPAAAGTTSAPSLMLLGCGS